MPEKTQCITTDDNIMCKACFHMRAQCVRKTMKQIDSRLYPQKPHKRQKAADIDKNGN